MSVHGLDEVRKRLLVDVDAPRQIHKQLLLRRKRVLQVGDVFRQAGEQYALTQLASNRPPADIIDDYSLLQEQRERDLLRSNQEVP